MKYSLIDPSTGEKQLYNSLAEANDALKAGKGIADTTRVNVAVHGTNDIASVPAGDLAAALQLGDKIATPEVERSAKYLKEREGIGGSAQVFLGKVLSELGFGVPELIYEHTASDEDKQQWEALKQQHQAASWIGGGLGLAGSTLLTAGIGGAIKGGRAGLAGARALEAGELGAEAARAGGLGSRILGAGLREAGVGAAYQLPHAVTEAALGDPQKAAEDLLIGGGLGFGIGGLSRAFIEAGRAAATGIERVAQLGGNNALRAVATGTDREGTAALSELLGGEKAADEFVRKEGLIPGLLESPQKYAERAKEQMVAAREKLLGDYSKLGSTGRTAEEIAGDMRRAVENYSKDPALAEENIKLQKYIDNWEQQAASRAKNGEVPGEFAATTARSLSLGKFAKGNAELQAGADKISIELYASAALGTKEPMKAVDALGKSFALDAVNKAATSKAEIAAATNKSVLGNLTLPLGLSMIGHPTAAAIALMREAGTNAIKEKIPTLLAHLDRPGLTQAITARAQSNALLDKTVATIKKALNASERGTYVAAPKILSVVNNFTGKRSTTIDDAYNDAQDHLQKLNADRATFDRMVKANSENISRGAPQIASAYQQQAHAQLNYLLDKLPKTNGPTPFASPGAGISTREKRAYLERLAVVADPTIVTKAIASNTLTRDMVTALSIAYPGLYQELKQQIGLQGSKHHSKLNTTFGNTASLLFGQPITSAHKNPASYQGVFMGATGTQTGAGGEKTRTHRFKNIPGSTMLPGVKLSVGA